MGADFYTLGEQVLALGCECLAPLNVICYIDSLNGTSQALVYDVR